MLENLKNLKLVCSLTMSDLLHTTRWMQQLQRDALKIALGNKTFLFVVRISSFGQLLFLTPHVTN